MTRGRICDHGVVFCNQDPVVRLLCMILNVRRIIMVILIHMVHLSYQEAPCCVFFLSGYESFYHRAKKLAEIREISSASLL